MKISIVYLINVNNSGSENSFDIPDDFLLGAASDDFEVELFSTDSVGEALEAATGEFLFVAGEGMRVSLEKLETACRFAGGSNVFSLVTWSNTPDTGHVTKYDRGYPALTTVWLDDNIEAASLINLQLVRNLNLAEWFVSNGSDEYLKASPVSAISLFMGLLGDVAVIDGIAPAQAKTQDLEGHFERRLQFCRPEHIMHLLAILDQLREFTDAHIRYALWKKLITPKYLEYIDRKYLLKMVAEWYELKTGIRADLDHPRNFNEHANRQKISDYSPLRSELADKYAVRKYIADAIGEQYLIPLAGVWERPEDIDFTALPEKFALKATHASGTNIIVGDKSKLDVSQAMDTMRRWMVYNYAAYGYELQYAYIKPRIVCEQFITCRLEYQFWCIDGDPKFVSVIHSPHGENAKATYDMDWNRLDFITSPPELKEPVARPANFDEMKEIAVKLSSGHSFARIDLLADGEKLWFGEITFTPASGLVRWTKLEGHKGDEIAELFF